MVHLQANILRVHAPPHHQVRITGLPCSGKKEGDCALLDRPRRFDVEVTEVAVFIVLVQHAFRFFSIRECFQEELAIQVHDHTGHFFRRAMGDFQGTFAMQQGVAGPITGGQAFPVRDQRFANAELTIPLMGPAKCPLTQRQGCINFLVRCSRQVLRPSMRAATPLPVCFIGSVSGCGRHGATFR